MLSNTASRNLDSAVQVLQAMRQCEQFHKVLPLHCRIELGEGTIPQMRSFTGSTSGLCCNTGLRDAWVTNFSTLKPSRQRPTHGRRAPTSPVLDEIIHTRQNSVKRYCNMNRTPCGSYARDRRRCGIDRGEEGTSAQFPSSRFCLLLESRFINKVSIVLHSLEGH